MAWLRCYHSLLWRKQKLQKQKRKKWPKTVSPHYLLTRHDAPEWSWSSYLLPLKRKRKRRRPVADLLTRHDAPDDHGPVICYPRRKRRCPVSDLLTRHDAPDRSWSSYLLPPQKEKEISSWLCTNSQFSNNQVKRKRELFSPESPKKKEPLCDPTEKKKDLLELFSDF